MNPWFEVIAIPMSCANTVWMFSALLLTLGRDAGIRDFDAGVFRVARWIFHEVKPFFRPFAVILGLYYALPLDLFSWVSLLMLVAQLVFFHFYKDIDDDDRWQRRKQKIFDKITITDGKLAVIPA